MEISSRKRRKARRRVVPENDALEDEKVTERQEENRGLYAGSEEKLLNLVVEIIVKIILKEIS